MTSKLNANETIFSQRLKAAREMKGLSLRDVANNVGLSHNAVSKYEKAELMPNSSVLIRFSQVLDKPVDYFFRPFTIKLDKIEFRKKSRLGVKKVAQIRHNAEDYFEKYLFLEESLGISTEFHNPLSSLNIASHNDVETAALFLRGSWNLGLDALPSVVEILEWESIKVMLIDSEESFDGFSGFSGNIPVIVLNKSRPSDRIRFTALHEVGHLLLKFSSHFTEKDKERLCHRFAGAMLIPEKIFRSEFGGSRNQISPKELISIKEEFGISISAIMARARHLGLINESLYERFCIKINQLGWRTKEPGFFPILEESRRFEQLLQRAAATESISVSMCASLSGKTVEEFMGELEFIS